MGEVLFGCEVLPDHRISHGAFPSAAGSEAGDAARVLELDPGVAFSSCRCWTVFSLSAGCLTPFLVS